MSYLSNKYLFFTKYFNPFFVKALFKFNNDISTTNITKTKIIILLIICKVS